MGNLKKKKKTKKPTPIPFNCAMRYSSHLPHVGFEDLKNGQFELINCTCKIIPGFEDSLLKKC